MYRSPPPRVVFYAVPDTCGAIRSSTPPSRSIHTPSRPASSPICPRDSTRGCTHVMCACSSTWSSVPRINLRLHARDYQHHAPSISPICAHLSAFMIKCSTSSVARRVSSAIVWNVIVRSFALRLNTDSISAMRQIFCRRNG